MSERSRNPRLSKCAVVLGAAVVLSGAAVAWVPARARTRAKTVCWSGGIPTNVIQRKGREG